MNEPRWIHGSRDDPPFQVHRHDSNTYLLRQSKLASYEAPFLFLLFGEQRALLLDTGAVAAPEKAPLRSTVDGLVSAWLTDNPREHYPLVVAHTHGHGDHVAGDAQFADRPDTTVVAKDVDAVRAFFAITDRPDEVVAYDLGGRVLEIVGIPGHHEASIAVFDARTGFLLTGDTVSPGRLYVADHSAFVDSLGRLVDFAAARDVTGVYGCHIEMTRAPGRDYPLGCRFQPDEPPLRMDPAVLPEVLEAARRATRPGPLVNDDFIIWNRAQTRLLLTHVPRLLWSKVAGPRSAR
jgi:glyoxylase-like metal-dependent hydrolase (beta-lactamase superfamily II)